MRAPFPTETRTEAIRLYLTGLTCEQVAKRIGANDRTVGTWVRDAGVSRGRYGHSKPRADRSLRRPALDDLYESGDSIPVVAARHGISKTALHNWRVEDLGVEEDLSFKGEWVRDGLVWRAA